MKKSIIQLSVLFLVILIAYSCGSTCRMSNKNKLSCHTWELSTIKGNAPDLTQFRTGLPFMIFDKQGKLTGSTGCNNYSGNYKVKKGCLSLDPGVMTRMFCQGGGEMLFLDAMKKVKNMKSDGDNIILLDGTIEIMTLLPKK
jgi:heat shock protein HslJ